MSIVSQSKSKKRPFERAANSLTEWVIDNSTEGAPIEHIKIMKEENKKLKMELKACVTHIKDMGVNMKRLEDDCVSINGELDAMRCMFKRMDERVTETLANI